LIDIITICYLDDKIDHNNNFKLLNYRFQKQNVMNREIFLKSVVALAGGTFIASCERSLNIDPLENELIDISDVPIEEIKNWFTNKYLSGSARAGNQPFKRKLDWDKAKNMKANNGKSLKWVPISYDDNNRPAIITWTDKTRYREDLKDSFIMPAIEGFVVYPKNSDDKFEGLLSQIAYDPYATQSRFNKNNFTGSLLLKTWDDEIKYVSEFLGGKMTGFYDSDLTAKNAGARPSDWVIIDTSYQTTSCAIDEGTGELSWTVTYHNQSSSVWISSGVVPPDATYVSSDFNYYGPYGGGAGGGYSPGGGTYSAPPTTYNYNDLVIGPTNSNREVFLDRLGKTLWATGLATSLTDFSYSKALTTIKAIGIDTTTLYPDGALVASNLNVLGRAVSGMAIGVSVGSLVIGLADGEFTWEEDGVNLLQLGLGVTAIAIGGWVAVGIGAVSVAVAVYYRP
jgi:hypothetical protein